MLSFLKASIVIFAAQIVILASVFFIGGVFMQKTLSGFYNSYGYAPRLAIALLTGLLLGNLLMGYSFSAFNPAWVAPISIFSVVVVQVVFTVLAFDIKLSPLLIPATIITALGCTWVSLLLQRG